MRRLWHDIRTHRLAGALFGLYWLVTILIIVVTSPTWHNGMPNIVLIAHLIVVIAAAALVAWWRDADEQRVWLAREPFGERRDDGDLPAKAEHVLSGASRLRRIDDRHDVVARVADAGVGGFGPKGAERAFGENQESRAHYRDQLRL